MEALERKNVKMYAVLSTAVSEGYKPSVRCFERYLISTRRSISPDTIKAFLSEKKPDGTLYSPSTIALRKTAIFQAIQKQAFDIRLKAEIREKAKEIRTPKPDRKILSEKTLSEKEIRKLTLGARSIKAKGWNPDKGISYSLIIETLALSGLRVSELCGIRINDCETIKRFTYIRVLGKGKKSRRIFIPNDLYKRIRKQFTSNDFLFVSSRGNKRSRRIVHREIVDLSIRILGRSVNPHLFRHSFATREIRRRGSVKAVSLYLGHSKTSITEEMYNHEELRPEDLFRG